MALFLGIDLGTTYFKAALFDTTGRLRGLGRRFVQKQTANNICELAVEVFWSTMAECVAEAMTQAGTDCRAIVAMSYSSQANSFILLDKGNHPLTPLILWPDERAGATQPALSMFAAQPLWRERTGMGIPLSPNSCINKLWWLQQQAIWEEVASVCTISDYLTLVLTGQKAADASTASLLGLLDVQACNWWDDALQVAQLQDLDLSPVFRMGTPVGKCTRDGAARLGLHTTTHFSVGGLDHHMAAMGAGIYGTNNISESTGTVLAAVESTDQYKTQEQICIAPGLHDHHFFRMAFDANGAGALEQYQKTQPLSIAALLEKPNPDVIAILESTAASLATIVQKLNNNGDIIPTGGGARSKLWVQIKADMLNRSFVIPACNEAACLGAAMMAAMGAGAINNIQDWVHMKERIEPGKGGPPFKGGSPWVSS
jgi:xylulokinase